MEGTTAFTLKEAAELTGLSSKAIARRCERGSLKATLEGGVRLISVAELEASGLLNADDVATPATDAELLRTLEALEHQKALVAQAGAQTTIERARSDELLAENALLLAKVAELEKAAGQRWYKRR